MRLLVVGVDAQGRSCVTRQHDPLDFNAIPGHAGTSIASLFASGKAPPEVGPSGEGRKDPDSLAPGLVSWFVINHEPYAPGERYAVAPQLHHRRVIDMICIIEGGGEMMLGDGGHPVSAGDCVLMEGTSHALWPGPQGCRLIAFALGAAAAA